jgi:hypothetical protein
MSYSAPTMDWTGGFLHLRRECRDCGMKMEWWGIDHPPYVVFDPADEHGAAEVMGNLLAIPHECRR